MQWLALVLPNLPVEIFTRGLPSSEPLAIADGRTLVACDAKALARGVRPGMASSAALALARELEVRPRDCAGETEALLGLAGWAAQFTPNVALEFHHAVLLEISGSLKLFGGLAPIVKRLREGAAALGYTVLIAAAPTPRGAEWLARAGREIFIEAATQLGPALAALPVRLAAREAATLEGLQAIGARTLGDVLALPRAGLARRFGQLLLDDLDRACGATPDPRAFFAAPATFHARLELPAEVTQTEALLFAAQRLFVQLEGFLAARSGGVQRLALRLFHADARFSAIPIGLVAPARDARHFMLLLRERLGRVVLRDPVRSLALTADQIVPLAGENLALFRNEAGAPGDWAKLVERLRARLGATAVQGLALADEHRPEHASQAVSPGTQYAVDLAVGGLRPLWLLPVPQPLEEREAVPQYHGPLMLLAGPERIESGWWQGDEVARDYFIARCCDDALLWIYRLRRAPGGWFLHGLFA
jgi:protein ImuB